MSLRVFRCTPLRCAASSGSVVELHENCAELRERKWRCGCWRRRRTGFEAFHLRRYPAVAPWRHATGPSTAPARRGRLWPSVDRCLRREKRAHVGEVPFPARAGVSPPSRPGRATRPTLPRDPDDVARSSRAGAPWCRTTARAPSRSPAPNAPAPRDDRPAVLGNRRTLRRTGRLPPPASAPGSHRRGPRAPPGRASRASRPGASP
jgi:hypothetical protein